MSRKLPVQQEGVQTNVDATDIFPNCQYEFHEFDIPKFGGGGNADRCKFSGKTETAEPRRAQKSSLQEKFHALAEAIAGLFVCGGKIVQGGRQQKTGEQRRLLAGFAEEGDIGLRAEENDAQCVPSGDHPNTRSAPALKSVTWRPFESSQNHVVAEAGNLQATVRDWTRSRGGG